MEEFNEENIEYVIKLLRKLYKCTVDWVIN